VLPPPPPPPSIFIVYENRLGDPYSKHVRDGKWWPVGSHERSTALAAPPARTAGCVIQ
jgi:hypothetical protein